jgi:pimeloyl-ACP methyl ester carboxylesterase
MHNETQSPFGLPFPIPAVWLLHGKGGSPAGTVSKIQAALELHWPGLDFVRPELPHHAPSVCAEESVEFLLKQDIPQNALILGVSLGGLVAARLQELGRSDLKVMAISSPTGADGVSLQAKAPLRMAFYSSNDEVIQGRAGEWPQLASLQRDFDWLTHDTDQFMKEIVRLFSWYLEGNLLDWADRVRKPGLTKQEGDEIVWRSMSEPRPNKEDWSRPWQSGRPRDFGEMGMAVKADRDWDSALGGWLHEFVRLKDFRCIAAEPPLSMSPEHRALLAGVADFFAPRFGLAKPSWMERSEYFLPELEYLYYCQTPGLSPDDPDFMCWPPLDDQDLFRRMARTPKELLRRNVIYEARSLTVL